MAAKKSKMEDRGETVGLMEPLLIGESCRHRTALTDLAVDLAAKSRHIHRTHSEAAPRLDLFRHAKHLGRQSFAVSPKLGEVEHVCEEIHCLGKTC